jgi:UDP-galactopyranose mutase
MSTYDFLVVGAGLFGSVCAYELSKLGNEVLVIDKRDHIGGNCYTKEIADINVHMYGPHIFHTNNKFVWDYINQFAEFNSFTYRPKVRYKNRLYSFPINLLTLHQVCGVLSPAEANKIIRQDEPSNCNNIEDYLLYKVGEELYEIFFKGYTEKQWGKPAKDLPVSIIKRLPIRLSFDDNYYFDRYQGIPVGGYAKIFSKLLRDCDVLLGVDYLEQKNYFDCLATKVIYTGALDRYFNYDFGKLEYRSLEFETEFHSLADYQGTAGINYTDIEVPYTRIIEHKHFEFGKQAHTIVTKEYSVAGVADKNDFYYPIENSKNQSLHKKYQSIDVNNIFFGGRCADYRYYNMDETIVAALNLVRKLS